MTQSVIDHQAQVGPETRAVRFDLAMTGAEGCAVRALGLIVRRGWYLAAAELHPGRPGDKRRLTVDVFQRDPSRSVETLQRQLERLFDIEAVVVTDAPPIPSADAPQIRPAP